MTRLSVRAVDARDPLLDVCAERLPDAALYDTAPWRGFLEAVTGSPWSGLLALRGGEPAGYLGWHVRRGPLGAVLNSHPWYGTPGGCRVAPGDDEARRALLRAFDEATAGLDRLASVFVLTPDETRHLDDYRAILGPITLDWRLGQVNALTAAPSPPLPRILEQASGKTRNLIRKALRQGFEVAVDEGSDAWDFLVDTHHRNLAAIGGRAKPAAHFAALRRHLPPGSRRLWIARDRGRPVAALLVAEAHGTVEYLTPVIEAEVRSRQPLSGLIVAAMSDAMQRHAHTWNWGGTWLTQHGLHHFKRGWGAVERRYAYVISATPGARARIREHLADVVHHYPWFYVYPFDQLTEPSEVP